MKSLAKLNILGLFLLFMSLSSCSNSGRNVSLDGSSPRVTVYYTKASDELGVALIPVHRPVVKGRTQYETAIRELFLGPNKREREKLELNTEVPQGSRLIDVKESNKEIKINISSRFMTGGGSESMQVRFRQLRETALTLAKGRPVYLYIDGHKAQMLGGEGYEVPQPLDQEDPEDDEK